MWKPPPALGIGKKIMLRNEYQYDGMDMTVHEELKYLSKVQTRLVRFCNYIESHHDGCYDDLYVKLSQVIGTIEEALNFDV